VSEAKNHLSRLLDRVEQGEEIIIGRSGRPVARLIPYRRGGPPREPGTWQGRTQMDADFDELPEEFAAAVRGDEA
jgi:prevent-host-death family protein